MVQNRLLMSKKALRLALDVRRQNRIELTESFCIFDFAENCGIEVKFVDIPSMEGLYIAKPRKIIFISSHRPQGRQRFTCAHELGHHFLRHRAHIDEIMMDDNGGAGREPQEIIADLFASYILMPSTTVNNGFVRRGWDLRSSSPIQTYTVAWWLGVGYSTLINQMIYGVGKMSKNKGDNLLKQSPKEIKQELLNCYYKENVIPIDFGWSGRPIDIFIKDLLVFSKKMEIDGDNIEYAGEMRGKYLYRGINTGVGRILNMEEDWSAFVRVSRNGYIGRCKYRHLEDIDDG